MVGLKSGFLSFALVFATLSVHTTFVHCEDSDEDGSTLSRRGPQAQNYWAMATIAANAFSPINAITSLTRPNLQPLEAIYNNPEFSPLFQELPKLMGELNQLEPEEQSNTLFLFNVYISLPPTVSPFFHQAISQMTSVAPALHDLTKFNIAAELSTYVQSVIDPIPNPFSRVASYAKRLQRRAPFQNGSIANFCLIDFYVKYPKNNADCIDKVQNLLLNLTCFEVIAAPSMQTIMGIVGEILLSNIGVPLPLIPFNILQQLLTMLVKAYIDGSLQLPKLPKLPDIPKMIPNALKKIKPKLPKKPKFKKPRF